MDESFSRVGFLYGMAFVLAVSKACTLLIWRTLPKPRPPLRQELLEAWRRRRTRERVGRKAVPALQGSPPVADEVATDGSRNENASKPIPPASVEDRGAP
jgi:hypothetical protein